MRPRRPVVLLAAATAIAAEELATAIARRLATVAACETGAGTLERELEQQTRPATALEDRAALELATELRLEARRAGAGGYRGLGE